MNEDEAHPPENLDQRLREWFEKEGYPLEFAVAAEFRSAGFHVDQGQFTKTATDSKPREIDVTASITASAGGQFVRAIQIVECKWTKNRPWVLFTDDSGMVPSARATQTIANELGRCLMWLDAGAPEYEKLAVFGTPSRSAFSGRQAFTKGEDQFYTAIMSVVSAGQSLAKKYDGHAAASPQGAVAIFPAIVIDGRLYEAFQSRGEIKLEPVNHLRCMWRGSPGFPPIATVDVLTREHAGQFARDRVGELRLVLDKMAAALPSINNVLKTGDGSKIGPTEGPRGMIGLPPLLLEAVRRGGKAP